MRQLLDHCIRIGAIEQGIQTALRLLAQDPLDESAHRSLIRLYLYQERFGAALQQYEQCRAILARDLGVDPDPETELLCKTIAQQSPAVTAEADSLPEKTHAIANAATLRARQRSIPTGRPVLAILSFSALEPQIPNYLAQGLAEDLAVELGRFRDFDVIAPTSTAVYRSTALSSQDVGAELGATFVLCGNIRTMRNDIHLSVRLIDAASDRQIWAESYDCRPDGYFAVQDDILHRLVVQLAGWISNAGLAALRRKRPKEWSAYELWLRGWDRLKSPDISAIREARTLFDQAITADPEFARPYVGLSLAHLNE